MNTSRLLSNFTIFVLFFGIAALQAIETKNWMLVIFWLAIGSYFLWADLKKK